jgi:hypothetical protein
MYKLSIIAGLLAGCVDSGFSDVAQAIGDDACPAGTPAKLTPAADQDLAFALDASGTQNYQCQANGTWLFIAPEADLFQVGHDHVTGHHFVGPTWEWIDGSTVVGAKVAGVSVDPSSIPWLLLTAKSHGPIDGKMTEITSVQRLSTNGGNAPAGACTPSDSVGVDYTARYFFYRTKADSPENNTRCGAQ